MTEFSDYCLEGADEGEILTRFYITDTSPEFMVGIHRADGTVVLHQMSWHDMRRLASWAADATGGVLL
jgi:hypothetical protein